MMLGLYGTIADDTGSVAHSVWALGGIPSSGMVMFLVGGLGYERLPVPVYEIRLAL